MRRLKSSLTAGLLATLLFAGQAVAANAPDRLPTLESKEAAAVAAQVDAAINAHLRELDVEPLPPASDEDFLRRASLDLAGRIPTPAEVTLFGLNPDDTKRSVAIEGMLETEDFARTWASYWREVIFSRATEVRSRVAAPAFEVWMTEQLQSGQTWDEIAISLLTATGNTLEDGSTGLVFAHGADPAEIAGEVSRLFLGIQIQCANCHNHPYDQWKREDFHELAAFFPRIRVRSEGKGKERVFLVESVDNQSEGKRQEFDVDRLFRLFDKDRDGNLTKAEVKKNKQFGKRFERFVAIGDKNADGALSREEVEQLPPMKNGGGKGEYSMPDQDDPSKPGTLTEPVFFINDKGVSFGAKDQDRRGALAEIITSPDNPWFARAFVNRIWAEMLGEGFYTPIDDIGPERSAQYTEVLDLLAAGFVANDYDVKWVYHTIALTDAYQRSAAASEESHGLPAFATASPTRLRGDQLYNAVMQVLDVESLKKTIPPDAMRGIRGRRNMDNPGRYVFGELFNYDASTPQADLMGNIPQALFMMNSPITGTAINGRGPTALGRLLDEFDDNDDALSELYVRVLVREPTPAEADICRSYIAEVGDRAHAFEDIMWSLMNSTEFLTKR